MSVIVESMRGPVNIAVDHHGRRPVILEKGIIEYEGVLVIDGAEIPESQRTAYLAKREEMRAKAEADHRSAELREARNKINFPFYTDAGGALLGKRPARSDENSGQMPEKTDMEDSEND